MRVHHLNNVNKALQILDQNNVSLQHFVFPLNIIYTSSFYKKKLQLL